MSAFIIRRLALSVVLLFIISLISFFIVTLTPGSPYPWGELNPKISAEVKANFRKKFHLDQPLPTQYAFIMRDLFTGNLRSIKDDRPVLSRILERLPATLALNFTAILISLSFGTLLGVYASRHAGDWQDLAGSLFAFLFIEERRWWWAAPFLVLATQNPLEQEGTYPLPEAQIDRFMMKVIVDYPTRAEERAILDTMATTEPMIVPRTVVSASQILDARHVVSTLFVDDKVRDYIVDIVLATRPPIAAGLELNGYVQYGASPRATIALTLAARAMAFLNGRYFVTPQDVKTVAMDVLRHRVSVTYEAEAENVTSKDVVERILNTLPVP